MSFSSFLSEHQTRIQAFMSKTLPQKEVVPEHLHQAMRYAVLNGGKRVRPLLVYATGEALGADSNNLDYPACAVELMHSYSLVHDDLPAMDDDELRRGLPTCHIAFDEATAILAGDALQALAFDVLTSKSHTIAPISCLEMVNCLANAVGSRGMTGGQALDLSATGSQTPLNRAAIEQIHVLKTGALITASIQLGALASEAINAETYGLLTTFAKHIGLCFQIQDDILNVEGSTITLGKQVGTDLVKEKATFATRLGLEEAKQHLIHSYKLALEALRPLGPNVALLEALAEFIVQRDR